MRRSRRRRFRNCLYGSRQPQLPSCGTRASSRAAGFCKRCYGILLPSRQLLEELDCHVLLPLLFPFAGHALAQLVDGQLLQRGPQKLHCSISNLTPKIAKLVSCQNQLVTSVNSFAFLARFARESFRRLPTKFLTKARGRTISWHGPPFLAPSLCVSCAELERNTAVNPTVLHAASRWGLRDLQAFRKT